MGANKYDELQAEKIVIVAGPSFGTAMKFVLFGAALGAAAVTLLNGRDSSSTPSLSAATEAANTEQNRKNALQRLSTVASRAKVLARQARDLAASTRDSYAPIVGDALLEARAVARANEEKLREDLSHVPEPRVSQSKISDEQA